MNSARDWKRKEMGSVAIRNNGNGIGSKVGNLVWIDSRSLESFLYANSSANCVRANCPVIAGLASTNKGAPASEKVLQD